MGKDENGVLADDEATPLVDRIEKTKTRQKSYALDLRVHTPASLGYIGIDGIDPAPALVRLAETKGLDFIAITDLYSGSFIDRIVTAAKDSSVKVIPGVSLRCVVGGCDDITVSCLFPENQTSSDISSFLTKLRIPATAHKTPGYVFRGAFTELLGVVEDLGGSILPSRIDKTPYRMTALPILVEEYGFRAFDLAYGESKNMFKAKWPKIKFQLFSFSNANALAQVGSRFARVKMGMPSFEGIREIVGREAAL